jgi:hypothetical protein
MSLPGDSPTQAIILESRATLLTPSPKRRKTAQHLTTKPQKWRASYVLRAHDAYKRRKCRCDGRQPCQHCQKRSIECHYATRPRLSLDEIGNTSSLQTEDDRRVETVSFNLEYAAYWPVYASKTNGPG